MSLLSILKNIFSTHKVTHSSVDPNEDLVDKSLVGQMGDMMISVGGKTLLLIMDGRKVGLWMTEGAYDYCHISDEKGHEHMRNYLNENLDDLYNYLLIPASDELYLLNIIDCTCRGGWCGSEPFWSAHCAEMIDVFRSIILRFVEENAISRNVSLIIVCSSEGTSAAGQYLSLMLKEQGYNISILVQQFSEMYANPQYKKYTEDIAFYKENFDTILVDESACTKRPMITSYDSLLESFNDYRYELIQQAKDKQNAMAINLFENLSKGESQNEEPFPMISRTADIRLSQYGQVRTLADIVKHLNLHKHYTNVENLLNDLKSVLEKYSQRGTIDDDVINFTIQAIKQSFGTHCESPFLDFDRFISLIDWDTYSEDVSTLDAIYSRRAKTKLLRIVELLNEIKRYTNCKELINDLTEVVSNEEMDDPFLRYRSYPLYFFMEGIKNMWDVMTSNGILNNYLLEQVIFTNHEKRLQTYERRCVIGLDFEDDGPCHPEVYFPKQLGTAPIYVEYPFITESCSSTPILVKSCGEGKGPNRCPELYEFEVVRRIIEKECDLGNYVEIDGFYIPIHDYRIEKVGHGYSIYPKVYNTRPIFSDYYGRIRFAGERDKCNYIDKIISKANLYNVWKSLEKQSNSKH